LGDRGAGDSAAVAEAVDDPGQRLALAHRGSYLVLVLILTMCAGSLAVKPAGRIVLVVTGTDDVRLPVSRTQSRELVLTGVCRYPHTWPLQVARRRKKQA